MSGAPNTSTITASVTVAASVPQIGARQPRVAPTASTIVNASTNSTTLARNAGRAAMASAASGFMGSAPCVGVAIGAGLEPARRPRPAGSRGDLVLVRADARAGRAGVDLDVEAFEQLG